jgi:GrpB-like predicted nucleotidyltransferase (UPF0157 family)
MGEERDPAVRIVEYDLAGGGARAGADHHLAVRDYLRAEPGEAVRYEAVKREAARRNPEDRIAYMAGKDAFIEELERRALDRHAKEL